MVCPRAGRGSDLPPRCLHGQLAHPPFTVPATHFRSVSERPRVEQSVIPRPHEENHAHRRARRRYPHSRPHPQLPIAPRLPAALIDTGPSPASKAGNARAIGWITRRSHSRSLATVARTSSYGASVTDTLIQAQIDVAAIRPSTRSTHARQIPRSRRQSRRPAGHRP